MRFTSKLKIPFKASTCLFLLVFYLLHSGMVKRLYAENLSDLNHFIGERDAVLLADSKGHIVFKKNVDIPLIPASTLKIFTALVALHYLGPDYRFVTEFYMDHKSNLKVRGYGDPFLISEILAEIAANLSSRLGPELKHINDLVLDDSYFKTPIIIPGVASSYEPYDAPNGALCVNFNTVNFKRKQKGAYVTDEPQTPLLPFVLKRVKASKIDRGRIILSSKNNEMTFYAGHLLLYFLKKESISLNGNIRIGEVQKSTDKLIFKYVSKLSLLEVISRLLEYSNNFIANQLLIASGIQVNGPPGTLNKGIQTALTYAKNVFKIDDIHFVEGSGISRKNRISAKDFYKIVKAFAPYHSLMRRKGKLFYKTGTLRGINARVGYIKDEKGGLNSFVLLINTPGKSPKPAMDILLKCLGL